MCDIIINNFVITIYGGFIIMTTLGMVLTGVIGLLAIILIAVIMLQSGRSGGLGAVSASQNDGTYWSKNKGSSMEGALEKYTKIGGALFLILALAVNYIG